MWCLVIDIFPTRLVILFEQVFQLWVCISLCEKGGLWEKGPRKINPKHGTNRCWLRLSNLSLHSALMTQPSVHPRTNITRAKLVVYSYRLATCLLSLITTQSHPFPVCCVQFFFLFFLGPFSKISYTIVLSKFHICCRVKSPQKTADNMISFQSFQDRVQLSRYQTL